MKRSLQYICKGLAIFAFCLCCITNLYAQSGVVDIGKSYANISKLDGGGTFNPGDIIELRVTFAVRGVSPSQITNVQVFDTIPPKTTYVANSMRVTTNEMITYKGPYTDAYDDVDPASCVGGYVLMNLGSGATKSTGGTIKNTDRPSFYTNTCILVACFRVKINTTAVYGDTINMGGKATYMISGVPYTRYFPDYNLVLSPYNTAPCSNGLGISAASDSLGTFASGIVQNRASTLAFSTTYVKQNINTGGPQDYNYAIVNNSSADGSTNPNSTMPESSASKRVFGLWDIAGDHTGATNPALGNPPAAPGTRGGYMVLINSSYNTDTAYRETLSNLCPNTYYEFSGWFRNVCPRCGCDSFGRGSTNSSYLPGPGNDSSGVKPNINFEIDGLAYYSSGDMKYDRITPWKKFGFTFLTKPGQTTANFLIRNNSPGGGGNDWALDDIKVSHCGPSLKMNYNPFVLGCTTAPFVVTLSDTIRYIYSNSYIYYKWQKSNVGGTVWADLTGPGTSGVGSPTMVNGQWQFVANLPSFMAAPSDSGKYFRVVLATSLANLTGNCAYTDGNATYLKIINCGTVLAPNFVQFKGQIVSKTAFLTWIVASEENISMYIIERSKDGANFSPIGFMSANNKNDSYYSFTDLDDIEGKVFYRIKMVDKSGLSKYSTTVLLSTDIKFEVNNLQNPILNFVKADVVAPREGILNATIYNDKGQLIKTTQIRVMKGLNNINIDRVNPPPGVYFLFMEFNNETIKKKLVKIN